MMARRDDERVTRRSALKVSAAAAAATVSFPGIVPCPGPRPRGGPVAASERITLGVIGIGPRCTYDLKSMLAVRGRAVRGHLRRPGQPPRGGQDAGRRALREQRLRALPRLPRAAGAARHRRGPDRHRRPLARRGLDPGGPGRQGRVQREALRADHRRLPEPGRHHEPLRPGLPGRHPAAERPQLPARRRSWPTAGSSASSTRSTPRSTCPGTTRLAAGASPSRPATWWTGTSGSARPPGGPTTRPMSSGGWRGYYDFDSGARLLDWGAHTVDLCQWANQADDTMPVEYEPSPDEHHRPATPTA